MKETLFANDITIYVENPKESNKSIRELISNYDKVVGQNVKTQKSNAFYIPAMNTWNLIFKTVIFTLAHKIEIFKYTYIQE